MSKVNLILVSLIAAVPGALLAFVMVMSFLNYADKSSGSLKGLAGASLLLGGFLALMPMGILVFGGPKVPKQKSKKSKDGEAGAEPGSEEGTEGSAAEAAEATEAMVDGDEMAVEGFGDEMDSTALSEELEIADDAAPSEEFEVSAEDEGGGGSDEFETEAEYAATEEFDFDAEIEEEEEPPKKKKS